MDVPAPCPLIMITAVFPSQWPHSKMACRRKSKDYLSTEAHEAKRQVTQEEFKFSFEQRKVCPNAGGYLKYTSLALSSIEKSLLGRYMTQRQDDIFLSTVGCDGSRIYYVSNLKPLLIVVGRIFAPVQDLALNCIHIIIIVVIIIQLHCFIIKWVFLLSKYIILLAIFSRYHQLISSIHCYRHFFSFLQHCCFTQMP